MRIVMKNKGLPGNPYKSNYITILSKDISFVREIPIGKAYDYEYLVRFESVSVNTVDNIGEDDFEVIIQNYEVVSC